MNLRIKPRRWLKREKAEELALPDAPNMVWSMDLMADRLADGRQFRLLNVLNDFNRIEVDFHCLPSGSCAASTRLSSGGASRWRSGVITAPNMSVQNWSNGQRRKVLH
ncbi:hypothetical protein ACVMH6_000143 [Rhizobium leguminosarum]